VQTSLLFAIWAWVLAEWGGDALILAALFLPTALGIAHGQDCVLMLAAVTGVYLLARRGQDFAAGCVLGLGLVKFHLFLLWPLALLLQKRWRMIGGAGAAIGLELLASLALAGPSGLRSYFDLLRMKDLNHLSPSPELMINVHSAAINLGLDHIAARGFLMAAAVALAAVACRRAPLWRWVAAASAGSLLVPPHVYGYDAALLLVPLLLAVFESGSKPVRVAATVLLTPLPFLAALAGSPWAAAAPVALMAFLGTLAAEARRAR
jgi:hypothetical protein